MTLEEAHLRAVLTQVGVGPQAQNAIIRAMANTAENAYRQGRAEVLGEIACCWHNAEQSRMM